MGSLRRCFKWAVAWTCGHRVEALADVFDLPTIAEFYPGYEVTSWFGVFAPAATPEPVIKKLREEVNAVLPGLAPRLNVTGRLEPLITHRRNSLN